MTSEAVNNFLRNVRNNHFILNDAQCRIPTNRFYCQGLFQDNIFVKVSLRNIFLVLMSFAIACLAMHGGKDIPWR